MGLFVISTGHLLVVFVHDAFTVILRQDVHLLAPVVPFNGGAEVVDDPT